MSTTDSEDASDSDGTILASCSLQEIRQEDLAAILPDQHECDTFGDFECRTSKNVTNVGDGSGSDMELSQQAVNALIQRTAESSSESESQIPVNPTTLYANTLLQTFVEQTQMLSTPNQTKVELGLTGKQKAEDKRIVEVKRKRGRPKKEPVKNYNRNPNVSPDSGIQNSSDHVSSPEPSPPIIASKNRIRRSDIKVPDQKLSVTSNSFDRILYGNTDRILYPPRKKVGRPPLNRKHSVRFKTTINTKNDLKNKLYNKRPIKKPANAKSDNRKSDLFRMKYTTLNNSKVMHSKHNNHNKHKKCKFKILKPIESIETKVSIEIDKLVNDFIKLCVISTNKSIKDVTDMMKTLKKTKKRKVSEYNERKKKKQNVSGCQTETNEQRLPLKKRHYHLSPTHERVDSPVNEKLKKQKDVETSTNNENQVEVEGQEVGVEFEQHNDEQVEDEETSCHIDEAIEACITRYSNKEILHTTTPKKRHRLEELAADSQLNEKNQSPTWKRNLGKKMKESKPTGIFMPSIDLESQIAASTIMKKTDDLVVVTDNKAQLVDEKPKEEPKRRARKRRAINRTGFPTVKKKKKKIVPVTTTTDTNTKWDRVPREGEKYSAFLQRTEKVNVSSAILEKLQRCVSNIKTIENESNANLPSPSSISTDSSKELDELSLETRMELLKKDDGGKKFLRDSSPGGSSNVSTVNVTVTVPTITNNQKKDDEPRRMRKNPRWRKKYLIAGLFSDYYKEDDETIRHKRTEAASKPASRIVYNKEEHPYGLLPPPYHCGKYLRHRKLYFQLPYDLWWQHTNSQLPGRDIVPSWNYRKIRTNVYNVKNNGGACEPQSCNCTSNDGCGDDCINRLVLAECPATAHRCQNQKIQRHEWSPGIEKFMTQDKGWGVRTKLPIKSGEFILEYVGEVVSEQEFKERMATRYAHDTHHYCLHLDGGLVIDGHRMGGDGRFVNHSCEPNCEMQKWSVNGQFRMALFSLRNIEPGEEITYDYNFTLFNPAEGQQCKCLSDNCRGVIGGKSQRIRNVNGTTVGNGGVNGMGSMLSTSMFINHENRVGRPRKNRAKRTSTNGSADGAIKETLPTIALISNAETYVTTLSTNVPPMKPITASQRIYIKQHHCFLLRNLNRTRSNRDRSVSSSVGRNSSVEYQNDAATTFLNHLNSLNKPRNMKTRRLAQAEDDPELNKCAKLATVFQSLWNTITTKKDEETDTILCLPFINLPSKRKGSDYYNRITEPIDFATIEQNISSGCYKSIEAFDADMNRVFSNALKFYGRTSDCGIAAYKLKRIYQETKKHYLGKFEEILGVKLPTILKSKTKDDEEDIIRCICGMYRDEGLMIQCERCMVWQHCECVKADADAASYHCERCVPREVDLEIPMDEFTEHGHRYYMTLLRGNMQLRQGDTVYVLRDIPIPGTDQKHTYETIGDVKYDDLDIFRIERLWKNSKTGQRFAYGHHYLRPHETFHEPTRKFFSNEVMRVPLYEAVPVELIISHCWVLDINTFCKGRPIDAPEEHIYICEYRVDKSARLFTKVSKNKYPICTKNYAFDRFKERLKISRTYTPHDLDPVFTASKPRGRKPQDLERENNQRYRQTQPLPMPTIVRSFSDKKTRLNKILLQLLGKTPVKQALDVSYLLEGGSRRRKKKQHEQSQAKPDDNVNK